MLTYISTNNKLVTSSTKRPRSTEHNIGSEAEGLQLYKVIWWIFQPIVVSMQMIKFQYSLHNVLSVSHTLAHWIIINDILCRHSLQERIGLSGKV